MVVFYDAVHPFFGLSNPEVCEAKHITMLSLQYSYHIGVCILQENTFQAILITDGTYSYTIFIYQCGLMGWDNGATIGFNAAGEMFANHDPSTSEVACLNIPSTPWSNVIFRLSANSSEAPPPCMSSQCKILYISLCKLPLGRRYILGNFRIKWFNIVYSRKYIFVKCVYITCAYTANYAKLIFANQSS